MGDTIRALCYINGSIINGTYGIEYDRGPEKAIRIKHGMTYEELENKLYRVFHINRTRNKILVIYRYPQVMQPTPVKYEPVPISDDEDMEIIFSTISAYSCLSSAELYINVQPIDNPQPIQEQDDYEAVLRHIATTCINEPVVSACSPNILHNIPENTSSRYTEE